MIHIFEIPDPNLPIHFVTFRALRRRISHVIGKKIAFSHYEGYKVYCACAVSRDLRIGGPPKTTRNNFLTPNCLFTIQLYGAVMTIKGSFIFEHLHVKAVFGRKKN